MAGFDITRYQPPGPVAAAFIRGSAPVPKVPSVDFIMGPVGSGKTNAAIFKLLRYVALMPACKDGVVRAKFAVVRADYRTLYKTTIPSWHRWFSPDYPNSRWIGGADRPASHHLQFATPRGRKIDLLMEFSALGDKRIEDVLRGWEGTAPWLNEVDLLDPSALSFFITRGVRYPPAGDLEGDAWLPTFVIGDLNPPGDPDNWIIKDFIDAPKPGFRLYQQPSGLSPQAENVKNLPLGYYEQIVAANDPYFIQRFVHGRVGYARDGMPVYPDFDGALNVAPQPLTPAPHLPITLGVDGALHPAGVVIQRAPSLQKRVLEEFYYGRMGPTRFAENLRAAINDRYATNPIAAVYYDPSADYGADKEGGEQSWIDIVRMGLRGLRGEEGIPFIPAPSNEPTLRIEAVRNALVFPIDATARGLIVSSGCKMLIKGFYSHYRYKLNPDGRVQNAAAPRPDKNEYANLHDALQYGVLGMDGRAGAITAAARGDRPRLPQAQGRGGNSVASSDFAL